MKIVPQGNRIVVEWVEEQVGNLVMPGNVSIPDLAVWRVVEVSDEGRRLDNGVILPIKVKVGDEIIFHPQAAIRLEPASLYGDRKLVMLDADAVLAIVEDRDMSVLKVKKVRAEQLK